MIKELITFELFELFEQEQLEDGIRGDFMVVEKYWGAPCRYYGGQNPNIHIYKIDKDLFYKNILN